MKSFKFLRLFFASISVSLLFSGCKNNDVLPEDTPKESDTQESEDLTPTSTVSTEIYDTVHTIEDKSCYHITLNYTDNYFKYTASKFRKDLMKLSFGATMSANELEPGTRFFNDIGFSQEYATSYEISSFSENSVHYIICKKTIDKFSLYSLVIKSTDYKQEWANNFTLGETGNHVGFDLSSSIIYKKLMEILSNKTNYKLWISGYSRGGAVANVLSSKLMKSEVMHFNEDNLYTYTFACPKGLSLDNAIKYKNVFNLVNSADMIQKFAPEEYGLYRCGQDIELYKENIDSLLPNFSNELVLPEFTINQYLYNNDIEYTSYLLKQILTENESSYPKDKYPYDLCSRTNYFKIEKYLSYLLGTIIGSDYAVELLTETFTNLNQSEIVSLVNDDGSKIFNILINIFSKAEISYENDFLFETCSVITSILKRYSALAILMYSNSNIIRMAYMHMSETTYLMLDYVDFK